LTPITSRDNVIGITEPSHQFGINPCNVDNIKSSLGRGFTPSVTGKRGDYEFKGN
jgi:hypothetical protein